MPLGSCPSLHPLLEGRRRGVASACPALCFCFDHCNCLTHRLIPRETQPEALCALGRDGPWLLPCPWGPSRLPHTQSETSACEKAEKNQGWAKCWGEEPRMDPSQAGALTGEAAGASSDAKGASHVFPLAGHMWKSNLARVDWLLN